MDTSFIRFGFLLKDSEDSLREWQSVLGWLLSQGSIRRLSAVLR